MPGFKALYPQTGEDIKVMSIREGKAISLIIAMAFIVQFFHDPNDYFWLNDQIKQDLQDGTRNLLREVGRGNRVHGLIPFNRYVSHESLAGKNSICHVGKIYNIFAFYMAGKIYKTIPEVEEVTAWMCSQIGSPVN